MQSFQNVTIGGHLGRDAEERYTQAGIKVVRFSVAVGWRKPPRDRTASEEWEDKTTWYEVSFSGRRADSQAPRLTKGTAVVVTGRLQPDIYMDRNNEARIDMMVFASDVIIADRSESRDFDEDRPTRTSQPANGQQQRPAAAAGRQRPQTDDADLEDLPF